MTSAPPIARSWTSRLAALSISAAIAVSVIYLPQSLLADLAANLGVAPAVAGIIATAVQGGYAIGILLFVPLADRVHPRRQVTVQGLILVVALIVSTLLPTAWSVAVGFLIVGLVANIAQVIIPAATKLSPADRRGATTSTLLGAILVGIFGGRIVASLLVATLGWRAVVVVFAVLVLVMLPFLRRALDAEIPVEGDRQSYGRLLLQTVRLVGRSPALAEGAGIQFFVFAGFNSVWTVMVLHLTGPDHGWTVLGAGLFGLVGLAAGLVTPFSGRFVDRFGPLPVAGVLLLVFAIAIASVVFDAGHIVLFGISMFLVTLGNQASQSATQNRALVANAGNSAQANTMYMFAVFLGGSAGAWLGSTAYAAGGMTRVALQATGFACVALAIWGISAITDSRRTAAARV